VHKLWKRLSRDLKYVQKRILTNKSFLSRRSEELLLTRAQQLQQEICSFVSDLVVINASASGSNPLHFIYNNCRPLLQCYDFGGNQVMRLPSSNSDDDDDENGNNEEEYDDDDEDSMDE
jgi:hypothetical protein